MRRQDPIIPLVPLLLVAACAPGSNERATTETQNESGGIAVPQGTQGSLIGTDGVVLGTLAASDAAGGANLKIDARGLQPGVHGLHIHATGKCEGPRFESAGPHWNPDGKKHGSENPQGAHRGDLPNVTIGDDGLLQTTVTVEGADLADLSDADGSALVLHMDRDDYRTDPSGNSGDRVACAVVAPNRP